MFLDSALLERTFSLFGTGIQNGSSLPAIFPFLKTNKQKKGQFYSSQGSVFSFMFPVFNGSVRVFTPSWPLEIINLEIACRSSELVTCKGLALESAGVPTSSSPRSSCGVSWNKRPALNKRPHLLLFMCDFGMQGLL